MRIPTRRLLRAALVPVTAVALALSTGACGGTGAAGDGKAVTVYSADGLSDWYTEEFAKFTEQTGISVDYVEAGSGEVVNRIAKEQSNPQADIVVTLPPFIQKAAGRGLLQDSGVDTGMVADTGKDVGGKYVNLAGNYLSFIAHPSVDTSTITWNDLLDPKYRGKIQYSTPGQAGDGTAVLVLLQQLMGKQRALDYLAELQANNAGPSSSTGKLQAKVDKGELLIANGDVQMNLRHLASDGGEFTLFYPATADGERVTVSLPYSMGLAAGAPHREAAVELMDFLLTADVQRTLGSNAMARPVRTDLADQPGIGRAPADAIAGVTVLHPDWNRVGAELDADIAAYNAAIGG